jgi:hypothetical protein
MLAFNSLYGVKVYHSSRTARSRPMARASSMLRPIADWGAVSDSVLNASAAAHITVEASLSRARTLGATSGAIIRLA